MLALLSVRALRKDFPLKGGLFAPGCAGGARGGRRQLRYCRWRNTRPGRGIRLRQIDHRPLHPAPDRAEFGRDPVPGPRRNDTGRRGAARDAARHADHFPGPVRVLEPAPHRAWNHRRGVDHPSSGSKSAGARGPRGAIARDGGAASGPPAPLPARVLRRAAATHRHRAGAGGAAQDDRLRRAGVGAGCVHSGAGDQSAGGFAGKAWA